MKSGRVFILIGFLFLFSCGHRREFVILNEKRKEERKFSLVAVGDVMLGRGVGKNINPDFKSGQILTYPFDSVAKYIRFADISFCNLECAITKRSNPMNSFLLWAKPEVLDGLKNSGFDIVSLANNHALDGGRENVLFMLQCLREKGIESAGCGMTKKEAESAVFLNANGLKIGFLAFLVFPDEKIICPENEPGIAVGDSISIIEAVKNAKRNSDIVVVSLHWGYEYSLIPSEWQRILAHKIVDAGASLVIGHHPHRIQGLEWYNDGLIAYSLGNFVFDQRDEEGKESIILVSLFNENKVSRVFFIPIVIENNQPKIAHGEKRAGIIERVKKRSESID